jgi:glycosyltransferase involved in cell wall biosynthesis
MKTILHVIETTGPGGAETVFIQLATKTSKDLFRGVAAVPGPGWVIDTLNASGLAPLHVSISRTRSALDWSLYSSLVRLIRENRVDLVHSHTLGISVYACIAGMRTGTKVVCTLHGDVDLARGDRRRGIKMGILRRGTAKLVVVSNYLRARLLEESRIPSEQVAVVHNGVDCDQHVSGRDRALRDEFAVADDEFLFGSIGNVREPKAYDNLLRAAAVAVRSNPALRFVVIGEGSGALLDRLLTLRGELHLEGIVHFAGFRQEISAALQNFDAFILSSRSEGFSIATVQAMAAGLAVVATKSGGPEEIVSDGADGLLVPIEDPAELAAAMLRVASDGALRETLGQAARATARARFSLAAMLTSYEQIYRDAVGLSD